MNLLKKFISFITVTSVTAAAFSGAIPVFAKDSLDGVYTVTADKTAQWAAQEKGVYDLRVHGWKDWETAAYMGFTLPDGFVTENLTGAELVLSTQSANASGTAYIYEADYSAFANGGQYGGEEGSAVYDDAPKYNKTEILSFTSPLAEGDFKIDITDYIKSLSEENENAAFRIDVKSQNTNNSWSMGSCTNGTAPKLVLEYDNPDVEKTEVRINIMNKGNVLKTYTDRVKDAKTYTLTNEQTAHIRKGNDIYYLPSDAETVFEISGDTAQINVEFSKITGNNLAMFEDFSADKDVLEYRRLTGNYTVENGKAVLSDGQKMTLPEIGEFNIKVECDVTGNISADGDGISQNIQNGRLTAEGDISALSGVGTVDNLAISVSDLIYNNLEDGTYTLEADVRRSDLNETAYIYAKTAGAPINRASAAGNDTWRKTVIQGIEVTDGVCEAGISGAAQFANITLKKNIKRARSEFLVGGDITEVSYVESCGGKYYDENGVEKDPIQLLAERGFNFARVRMYNNPGKDRGDGTYYLPEGFQNVEDGLSLAKRAKDKGMQVELTLYYSDYWADGGRQLPPKEWQEIIKNLSETEKIDKLEELVYEFTKDTMLKMKAQNTLPEYVSLGNEMQGGIMYPYGRTGTNNFKNLARFLNAGAKAVREVSPDSKIVLHLDGKMSQYQSFFDKCNANNVDYDVIGPSYYPFWTGNTVDEIVSFYNGLIERYDKDILVMETGYNFSPTKPDGYPGQLSDNGPYNNIYPSSPEGQRAFMEEVFQGLRSVSGGRCIGDLYWDPMMIYHDGVGWAMRESDDKADTNVVSNTTLFDFEGKALPAFDSYSNGYTPGLIGIGGAVYDKAGEAVKNSTVALSINGNDYNVNTDSHGGYFIRIPYNDEIKISMKYCDTPEYTLDMTDKSIANGIDFSGIKAFIGELSVKADENGNISFDVEYQTEIQDGILCVALYDENGVMQECKINQKSGVLENDVPKGKEYSIKAFLWNKDMKPLCENKTNSFYY